MLSFVFLLSLLLVSPLPLCASPVPAAPSAGTQGRPGGIANLLSLLCQIKPISQLICPHKGASSVSITTPLGSAIGVPDTSTVGRFVVRYANAGRWQDSVMVTKWELPNNSSDPTALPLACPQPFSAENSQDTDEDCLSMILYVPASAAAGKIPALMWIHGGSFIVGSATGPGLNGAVLAQATNSIVAVVQYRLGAFGFLSPTGETNLAVKDMVTALKFLQKVLPSFNGDTSKVTIAGQSSGASMVRALLATPSANSLFKSAVLQSDPMNYGFLSPGTFQTINNFFKSQLPCSDSACLNSMSTGDILDISLTTFGTANSLDASAGAFEPMRPVRDGLLITSPLDSTAPFPSVNKPILVSTVQNEAGPAIFNANPDPVPESSWPSMVNDSLGEPRTSIVVNSSHYKIPASAAANAANFDARFQLQSLGTDQLWRCPSWTFARNWAAHGGKVYVAQYVVGATYPDNSGISYCTQGGTVCHEDDIQIVFGTCASPNSQQKNVIKEIQARYKAFLNSGNPNASGFSNWPAVAGSNVNAILLGNNGVATAGACDPSFWGSQVPYDYQVFGA